MKAAERIFTNDEAARRGISRQQLALLVKRGELERVARGVYCKPGEGAFAEVEAAVLFKRGTDCVVALESALRLHGFTTAMPHALWIAMRRGARKPAVDFPLEVVRVADDAFEYGVQERIVDGATIRVYSPAKRWLTCSSFADMLDLTRRSRRCARVCARSCSRLTNFLRRQKSIASSASCVRMSRGFSYRPTMDADLEFRGDGSPDNLLRVFRDVANMSGEDDDGLRIDAKSVRAAPIREDDQYGGVRVTMMAHIGTVRIPVQFDVGIGDAVTPVARKAAFPSLLD